MAIEIVPLMGLPADDDAVKALLDSYGITKAPKAGSSVGSKEGGPCVAVDQGAEGAQHQDVRNHVLARQPRRARDPRMTQQLLAEV